QIGIREVDEDQLAEMAHAEVDAVDAALAQRADDVLEHGPVADRHERLGNHGRVRAQPRAQTSRKYDRPHRSCRMAVAGGQVAAVHADWYPTLGHPPRDASPHRAFLCKSS